MIISHKHKFIFIKCRKTASTSMEILLERLCGKDDIIVMIKREEEYRRNSDGYEEHMGASEIKERIGDEIWDEYFKFCFVRNPFDMLVSYYYWERRAKLPTVSKQDFHKFIERMKKEGRDKYHNYNLYTINNTVAVDFIGRYENLKEDLSKVFTKLGFEIKTLPRRRVNVRKVKGYKSFYNGESRLTVKRYWKKELKLFGYKF